MILVMKLYIDSFFANAPKTNSARSSWARSGGRRGGALSRTEHKPRLGYTVKMTLNLSVMSKVEDVFFVLVMKPLLLGIF